MQDVNLLAPAPAGEAIPSIDSLEFQDIAHTAPSRKAPAAGSAIPMHDMNAAGGSAAFPAFDASDVPLGPAVGDLHGADAAHNGLLGSAVAAPGGPGTGPAPASASAAAAAGAGGAASPRPDPSANASFYQLAYYRTHFDVTTAQIGSRLLRALLPTRSYFYGDSAGDASDDKPDLYGPFWVATTLVFLMAATGNFASYFALPTGEMWNYDMEKVTVAATVFYSFVFPVPLVLWAWLRYIECAKPLVTIISLYGYSLVSYLPVCVICITPVNWVRWLAVSIAAALSTRFVLRNLTFFGPNLTPDAPVPSAADEPTGAADAGASANASAIPADRKHKLFIAMCVVAVFHLGLAATTKFYFFDYAALATADTPAPAPTPTP